MVVQCFHAPQLNRTHIHHIYPLGWIWLPIPRSGGCLSSLILAQDDKSSVLLLITMLPLLYHCQDARPSPMAVQATTNAPPYPLFCSRFISLYCSFLLPLRCHNNFWGLPWQNRLPVTCTRQSRSQQGTTSHVPLARRSHETRQSTFTLLVPLLQITRIGACLLCNVQRWNEIFASSIFQLLTNSRQTWQNKQLRNSATGVERTLPVRVSWKHGVTQDTDLFTPTWWWRNYSSNSLSVYVFFVPSPNHISRLAPNCLFSFSLMSQPWPLKSAALHWLGTQ